MGERILCRCLNAQYEDDEGRRPAWSELRLHLEVQETQCEGWNRLLSLIDEAAADGRENFSPGSALGADLWRQIVVLPPTISRLKQVKRLELYGSSLVRIPPEIGEMSALEEFDPYTSYRLHWFPYEITRCRHLKQSRISTRALYGNHKYRPPFPRLPQGEETLVPSICSVCRGAFTHVMPHQFWVSLRVAKDVLPLLVHACSDECVVRLPEGAKNYIQKPHKGGLHIAQPEASYL